MTLRRSLRIAGQPAPAPAELPSRRPAAVTAAIGPEVLLEERIEHYRKYKHYEADFGWPETRAMQDEYTRLLALAQRDHTRFKSRNVAADNRHFAEINVILQRVQSSRSVLEKCRHISQVFRFMRNHSELLAAYPSFRKQTLQQLEGLAGDLDRVYTHDDETEAEIMSVQSMIPAFQTFITTLLPRHPLFVHAH